MGKKSQLDEFRDMVDGCDDKEALEAAQQLLKDILRINAIKFELSNLESGLTTGKKAMFYFFTSGLTEDEIVFAAERTKGKLNRVGESEKKIAEKKAKEELEAVDKIKNEEELTKDKVDP